MSATKSTGYNGYKNYETWNCALCIDNEESSYRAACRFMRSYSGRTPYADFIDEWATGKATEDGVEWLDPRVSLREMNAFMRELNS